MNDLSVRLSFHSTAPEAFNSLPSGTKAHIAACCAMMLRIAQAESVGEAIRREAAAFAGRRGFSAKRIEARYYELIKNGGDWRIFLPRAGKDAEPTGQPPEFLYFWQQMCIGNQRKIKPAWREVERMWKSGQHIPGYGTWRDWWRENRHSEPPTIAGYAPEMPRGLSYGNLMNYKPAKATMTIARHGVKKFREEHVPLVLRTRVGLRPGQVYMYDDAWRDFRCTYGSQEVRPLELGCLDVASAYKLAWGMRPELENEWTKRKERIKKVEMKYLIAAVHCRIGFHKDGLLNIVESGTAGIDDTLADILFKLSGEKIKVDRGGMQGGTFCDQFRGAPVGNSRFKAMIESAHSLVHNETAALPGQMGRNRESAPQQLHGLTEYVKHQLLAVSQMPPALVEKMLFPIQTWTDVMHFMGEVYDRIHDMRDHNLEGWEANGWTAMQWRLGEGFPWQPQSDYLKVPAANRAALDAIIQTAGNHQTVKLNRREVWQMHQCDMARLPKWTLPMILGDEEARKVVVQGDHTVILRDRSVSPDPIIFSARLNHTDGTQSWAAPGRDYVAWFNPFDPDHIVLADANGAVLGVCDYEVRGSYIQTKKEEEAMGRAAKMESELKKEYVLLARKAMREKHRLHENNVGVYLAAKAAGEEPTEAIDVRAESAAAVLSEFGGERADKWN